MSKVTPFNPMPDLKDAIKCFICGEVMALDKTEINAFGIVKKASKSCSCGNRPMFKVIKGRAK